MHVEEMAALRVWYRTVRHRLLMDCRLAVALAAVLTVFEASYLHSSLGCCYLKDEDAVLRRSLVRRSHPLVGSGLLVTGTVLRAPLLVLFLAPHQ